MDKLKNIGIVIIGRNEGERLISSLKSVISDCPIVVYVDFASTDDSKKNVISFGVNAASFAMKSNG